MDTFFIVLIGIIILIVLSYLVFYNKVMRLENRRQEASAGIDIALSKRYELINNLVEVVKGYAVHEKEVLSLVTSLRQSNQSLRNDHNNELSLSQTRLFALAENYPDLKASNNFLHLQKALTDCEEHLQAARRLMNRSVAEINTTITTFPGTLYNNLLKMTEKQYFEAESISKEAVKVEF